MRYGERLKSARVQAGLTQEQLAKLVGTTQANISGIEKNDKSESSKFTYRIAQACGVSALWLETGDGEMAEGIYVRDERLKHALGIMQQLPEYALDDALKEIERVAELIRKATDAANK